MSEIIINVTKRAPWGFRRGFVKQHSEVFEHNNNLRMASGLRSAGDTKQICGNVNSIRQEICQSLTTRGLMLTDRFDL